MRVLFIEPFGHVAGHFSVDTKYLVRAIANAGADVTLLTFDGLLGNSTELNAKVTHISFVSQIGAPARLVRHLPYLFPSRFVQNQVDLILSTVCTFVQAFLENRKTRYDVIHIFDAYMADYAIPWYASVVSHCRVVFTLHNASREAALANWRAKLREAISHRRIMISLHLSLSRLLETRLATALRRFLYRRAAKRNSLAFICYTRTVHDSFLGSPFCERITTMFQGTELPEARPLTKEEAREHLGLSQNKITLLHFGVNHINKNFEVIFEAVQGFELDCQLVFAGKVELERPANIPWRLAQKYGLEQNTIIINKFITDEEARYYFYAADALILSHRKDYKESSGVLSDAAHFILPVIAADVGEIGELVTYYGLGLTFEAEDPQSLRRALLSFLNLKGDEGQETKRNLARFALAHSWQESAQRHMELYQSLLEQETTFRRM